MILVQIARDWGQIKQVLFQGPPSTKTGGGSGILPPPSAPWNLLPHIGPIPILPLPIAPIQPIPLSQTTQVMLWLPKQSRRTTSLSASHLS